MYARLPTEKELAGTGFTPDDYAEEAEVWPDNWPSFSLFCRLQTQWRYGMAGRTGLDYLVLFALLDRMSLAEDERENLLNDIQTLEIAALNEMHKEEE